MQHNETKVMAQFVKCLPHEREDPSSIVHDRLHSALGPELHFLPSSFPCALSWGLVCDVLLAVGNTLSSQACSVITTPCGYVCHCEYISRWNQRRGPWPSLFLLPLVFVTDDTGKVKVVDFKALFPPYGNDLYAWDMHFTTRARSLSLPITVPHARRIQEHQKAVSLPPTHFYLV